MEMINKASMKNSNTTPPKADDSIELSMSGHVKITDKTTGEVLLNKRNAIHYGNMARVVAQALTGDFSETAYIHWMAFGNGGTGIDTSGKVTYKTPRISEGFESSTDLYSRTYEKDFDQDGALLEVITGPSYTDLKMTVTLDYNEPEEQEIFDTAETLEGDYVFDELGLFAKADTIDDALMLTHVIFHPVQKSQNRVIEIVYTVRVQLS
jgi:hypothetical protein